MSILELLQGLAEQMGTTAAVKTIYGEPIPAEGKVIIPVARVAYGLGSGFGTIRASDHTGGQENQPGGQSGGGGIVVSPMGVLEVTAERTRFIPTRAPWLPRLSSILATVGIGLLFARRAGRV